MEGNKIMVLMVAVVAIVGIFGILQFSRSDTPMAGYAVSSDAPPEPEPVPFDLAKCGNNLCELGFEDSESCPSDCTMMEIME